MKLVLPMALTILIAGCGGEDEQPPPPPPPQTAQPYSGLFKDQVNAIDKAKQVEGVMQQSEEERRQQAEQASQ